METLRLKAKKLLSGFNDLYAYYRDEPISSWREVAVVLLMDLPPLLVVWLLAGFGWVWYVSVVLWQFASIMLFCLYRKRKKRKHSNQYE